tara:strand:+ start:6339 stop:6803 length:465 start_codon:yes stop_codon:yes gene_type:complete
MQGSKRIPLHRQKKFKENLKPDIVQTKGNSNLGSIHEYEVATFLMRKGCTIFKNMSPVGPVDMIIMYPNGKLEMVDVKTMCKNYSRKDKHGKNVQYWEVPLTRTDKQREMGVNYLAVHPETGFKYFVDHNKRRRKDVGKSTKNLEKNVDTPNDK